MISGWTWMKTFYKALSKSSKICPYCTDAPRKTYDGMPLGSMSLGIWTLPGCVGPISSLLSSCLCLKLICPSGLKGTFNVIQLHGFVVSSPSSTLLLNGRFGSLWQKPVMLGDKGKHSHWPTRTGSSEAIWVKLQNLLSQYDRFQLVFTSTWA